MLGAVVGLATPTVTSVPLQSIVAPAGGPVGVVGATTCCP